MKKLSLSLLAFFILISSFAQTIHSQVDKRIETLSIIARLAEYKEYNDNSAKKYVADIHKYFDSYKKDTLIRFMQYMRSKDGIGFDKVMGMATCLNLKGRDFSLIDSWKEDLHGWNPSNAIQFVSLLNAFYKKAHFDNFFKNETAYYSTITQGFDSSITKFNQSCYYQYYGKKPDEKFNLIIGCGNGDQNYGLRTNSIRYGKQVYAIRGSVNFDKNGNPLFSESSDLPVVIHEFNHSFINPVLNSYENNDTLKSSATILLDTMKTEMANDNYGDWQTLVNESLVRASVVRYLMANNAGEQAVHSEIVEQNNRGFLWTKSLVDLLGIYERNRNTYPTFDDFYPKVIYFFDTTAMNITTIKNDFESKIPNVVSIEPFANNTQDVDPNLKEMTIHFSETMNDGHYSFNYGELGSNGYPISKVIGFLDDKKSIKIGVNLKPDTEYNMIATGFSFKSAEGYPLKNYIIKFKTRKQ